MPSGPIAETPPAQPVLLEERFQELAVRWHQAVAHQSSSAIRYGHPDYLAIIALGEPVVPLLLRDLQANRRHWFAALKAIAGVDPVPPEDVGKIAQMADAWLRWGRERGYQW